MENNTMKFYPEYLDAIDSLPEEYRSEAIMALVTLGVRGYVMPGLSPVVHALITALVPSIAHRHRRSKPVVAKPEEPEVTTQTDSEVTHSPVQPINEMTNIIYENTSYNDFLETYLSDSERKQRIARSRGVSPEDIDRAARNVVTQWARSGMQFKAWHLAAIRLSETLRSNSEQVKKEVPDHPATSD